MRSLTALSSPCAPTRDDAVFHKGRTAEVISPHVVIRNVQDLAKQWKMRYSEDNVNMVVFQIGFLITMVFEFADLGFMCNTPKST